jgi:hypothetical protein
MLGAKSVARLAGDGDDLQEVAEGCHVSLSISSFGRRFPI